MKHRAAANELSGDLSAARLYEDCNLGDLGVFSPEELPSSLALKGAPHEGQPSCITASGGRVTASGLRAKVQRSTRYQVTGDSGVTGSQTATG